jgi:hypothetical protein
MGYPSHDWQGSVSSSDVYLGRKSIVPISLKEIFLLLAIEQLHMNVRPRDTLDALADVFTLAGLECQGESSFCFA